MKKQTSNRRIILNSQGWLFKWRWWIFGLLTTGYILLELVEHPIIAGQISNDMILELVLFTLPLGIAIYLFEVLLRVVAEKDQAVQLLDEKHRLILQLAKAQDWDELVTMIVQYPETHVKVARSWLQVYDESAETFQVEGVWTSDEGVLLRPSTLDVLTPCSSCSQELGFAEGGLRPCVYIAQKFDPSGEKNHCLPLFYGTKLVGLLGFVLPAGTMLDRQAESILNASDFEIASALETAGERRARLTSELSNVARGERLLIARDLHDTLGQSLGYLHLKLDQFTQDGFSQDVLQLKPELERMHLVADEAYELVRGALVIMHQDDDVRMKLCDLIEFHGKMIANRTGIDFSISCNGRSGMLPVQIVRQINYAAKEALYNVERHARARCVNVTLDWGAKDLTIHIEDDGVGFDPQTVHKEGHFGLGIMHERIEACNGHLSIESAPDAGTHVKMWLPTICDEELKTAGKQA